MSYLRTDSPLHAARASAACAWCFVLAALAFCFEHPLMLGVLLCVIVAAGTLAGAGAAMRRAALLSLPFALMIAAMNVLVAREGLTVIARLGELGPLGKLDLTLEAAAYGGVLALRAVCVLLAFALYSACVDPDEVLRLFRRASPRSALTASLATRMIPVLRRDATRIAAAQRGRPGPAPSRLALLSAVSSNALDRAVDVAAALELRGYGAGARPAALPRPWSRHDIAFAASAAALAVIGALALASGIGAFATYPRLAAELGQADAAAAAALAGAALLPFASRRGIAR